MVKFHRKRPTAFFGVILTCLIILVSLMITSNPAQAAVIFTKFVAIPSDSQVAIQWTTASEINTQGFYVVSSSSETGTYTRVSSFIPRQGTGITGASYEFIHSGLTNGVAIFYKLEIINNDLTSIFTGAISTIPNPPTATPTQTATPTFTQTPTLTLTSTITLTPTISTTATTTATITLTPTKTATVTSTRTHTLIPSATRRPATAVPTRTLVRIMTATSQTTNSGGSYPAETETGVTSTLDTKTTPTPGENAGGDKYPGETTPGTSVAPGSETESTELGFITQGTPVPFWTPTPASGGAESETHSTIWGWIIGIGVGLGILGGAGWYYFRQRKINLMPSDDLFKDDPE